MQKCKAAVFILQLCMQNTFSWTTEYASDVVFYLFRVTYYVEFLPKKCRGACIMMLEVWWALGSILAALYALVIFPNGEWSCDFWCLSCDIIIVPDPIMELPKNYHHLNWRIYLISCCTPSIIVLIFFLVC